MKATTPDKQLLTYLKDFGIGNYQRIDLYLKKIFPTDLDYQAFINQKRNGKFWSLVLALDNHDFIIYRMMYGLDGSLQLEATIQPKGLKYLIPEEEKKFKLFGIKGSQIKKYVVNAVIVLLVGFFFKGWGLLFITETTTQNKNDIVANNPYIDTVKFFYPVVNTNPSNQLYTNNYFIREKKLNEAEINLPKGELTIDGQSIPDWLNKLKNAASGRSVEQGSTLNDWVITSPSLDESHIWQPSQGSLTNLNTPGSTPVFVSLSGDKEEKFPITTTNPFSSLESFQDWQRSHPGNIAMVTSPIITSGILVEGGKNHFPNMELTKRNSGFFIESDTKLLIQSNPTLTDSLNLIFKSVGWGLGARTASDNDIKEILNFIANPDEEIYIFFDGADSESKAFAEDFQKKLNLKNVFLLNSILGFPSLAMHSKFTIQHLGNKTSLFIYKLPSNSL